MSDGRRATRGCVDSRIWAVFYSGCVSTRRLSHVSGFFSLVTAKLGSEALEGV